MAPAAETPDDLGWVPAKVPPRSPSTWAPVIVPPPTTEGKLTFRAQTESDSESDSESEASELQLRPESELEPQPQQPVVPEREPEPQPPPPAEIPPPPPPPTGPAPSGGRRRATPVVLPTVAPNDDQAAAAQDTSPGVRLELADGADIEGSESTLSTSRPSASPALAQRIATDKSSEEAKRAAKAKLQNAVGRMSAISALGSFRPPKAVQRRRRGSINSTIFAGMETATRMKRCRKLHDAWNYAFDPHGRFRMLWDASMLVLVVYSCFYVPYKTAFVLERILREDPGDNGMQPIDWLVDGIFYVDLILNFWTGYDTGYMVVTDKTLIAKNYLKTRFAIDLMSTVEWDLIVRQLVCGAAGCTGEKREVNDMTATFRLLKVARLARAGPLIRRLSADMTVHTAFVDALVFFLYVLVCAHVLACLFFMMPILATCKADHQQMTIGPNGETIEHGPSGEANHTCMATSWRTNFGLNDANNRENKPAWSQYIDAAYWSITTMTTIGYGDRSPGNEPEIAFTMCAELVGLVFFVLLLDRITTVYEELRRDHTASSAIKDEIVQFLSRAVPHRVDSHGSTGLSESKGELIKKVVSFLKFKNGSQTHTRTFDHDGVFSNLSQALQEETTAAVFVPLLQEVRLFGHCSRDKADYKNVARLFNEADPDGSGELNEVEIRSLIVDHFGVNLSEEELKEAIDIMDISRTQVDSADGSSPSARHEPASITLDEFEHWWYLQKHGRPKLEPCPDEMLHYFALRLKSECSSPGDVIVRKGEYGDRIYMLLQGNVHVRDLALAGPSGQHYRQGAKDPFKGMSTKGLLRSVEFSSDTDLVFGLIGVLNDSECTSEYERMRMNMRRVVVHAAPTEHDYCECVFFTQDDFLEGLIHDYYGISWEAIEPGQGEREPALQFMQEYARNSYYKYYHPHDHYWGKYNEEEDYLKDPHERQLPNFKTLGRAISSPFAHLATPATRSPRPGNDGDGAVGGRRMQAVEARLRDVEVGVKGVNDKLAEMAKRQTEQHEELMAMLAEQGRRGGGGGGSSSFGDSVFRAADVTLTRPHTAAALEHHSQLEDLMASVRAEHAGATWGS